MKGKKERKKGTNMSANVGVRTRVNGAFRRRERRTVNGLSSFCIFPCPSISRPLLDEEASREGRGDLARRDGTGRDGREI